MKYFLLAAVAFTLGSCVFDVKLARAHSAFRGPPLPYSCDQVRTAVEMFSIPHLKALGKKLGIHLAPSQMREAQKCLH